jgi:drug/metabolite transporter (DMT)-like permease
MAGSFDGINWRGDLLALGMTIGMGIIIVIYRKFSQTPASIPMVGSSILLLPACWIFGDPMAVVLSEIAILAGFGAVFALASVLLAEAAKRVPSGEAALLISALETPLAPLWAWMILAELPPLTTFIGGAIILVAVTGSQFPRKSGS